MYAPGDKQEKSRDTFCLDQKIAEDKEKSPITTIMANNANIKGEGMLYVTSQISRKDIMDYDT